MEENEIKYVKALRLLLEWANQCDFGLDNIMDECIVDSEEFEKRCENLEYTESMILYAMMWLEKNDTGRIGFLEHYDMEIKRLSNRR